MLKLFSLISTVCICLSSAQWLPFLDSHNMSPFGPSLPNQLILPKESTTKIPIILLLKPKRAKSLSTDTNTEFIGKHLTSGDSSMSLTEWMEMPDLNTDALADSQTHLNQQISAEAIIEPDQQATEQDHIKVQGRGGDRIQWSGLNVKKNSVTSQQLASISHLFPKFAAMSPSNTEFGDTANRSGHNFFEDALKKFTSNLTDLEHRKSGNTDKTTEETDNNSESSTDSENIGIIEALKSSQTENRDDNQQNSLSFSQNEQKDYIRMSPQKSDPFINERNSIKVPIRSESEDRNNQLDVQTIMGQSTNKGWIPIKSRERPKHETTERVVGKPFRPKMHFPSKASTNYGQNLYQNNEQQMLGMPEPYNRMASVVPPPHMLSRRYFSHSFVPISTKQTIRHVPFNHQKYSSYLTETELLPNSMMALEMTADANKPQHMEPNKGEEAAIEADPKHKDVIEQKEQMIDNKHVINEKHMIINSKHHNTHGLEGEELIGQHITCCDILNGQNDGLIGDNGHNGPPLHHHHPVHHSVHHPDHHHVIHEEEIKTDFDDDKEVHNFQFGNPKDDYPVHFGHNFGQQFGNHHYFEPPLHQKKHCEHPFGSSYPHTYWPPQVYRRPVYRPKFFYKPLLFG